MDANAPGLNALSDRTIGCAWAVARELACGFLEKVHENALANEVAQPGMGVAQQQNCKVTCDGVTVRDYFTNLLVEEQL